DCLVATALMAQATISVGLILVARVGQSDDCSIVFFFQAEDGIRDHVPGKAEAYYDALDRDSLGLVQARVETYAGIVFATWAKDAPSLEAYLGDARWYLDTVFNRRDGGMQALGPMKWLEPVNWKTMVDNC